MMRRRFLTILLAWLVLPVYSCVAIASDNRAMVYVHASGQDTVGNHLIYELREGIRRSANMDLALSADDAAFGVHIVTIDPDDNGYQTAYSVTWTVKQLDRDAKIYWTSNVGICGGNRVSQCASSLIAKTDNIVTAMQEALYSALKDSLEKEKSKKQKQKYTPRQNDKEL